VTTIVRDAVAVARGEDLTTLAPFRVTRISRLVLTASRLDNSASYYSRPLGDAQASGASRSVQVGSSTVTIASGGSPSLRIVLAAFDRTMAHKALLSLGITPQTGEEPE
jgi:hypothetical protein